jgi:hypothetical protein
MFFHLCEGSFAVCYSAGSEVFLEREVDEAELARFALLHEPAALDDQPQESARMPLGGRFRLIEYGGELVREFAQEVVVQGLDLLGAEAVHPKRNGFEDLTFGWPIKPSDLVQLGIMLDADYFILL